MGVTKIPEQLGGGSSDQGSLRALLETATDERAARRSLRAQIARLERDLSGAFVTAFPMGGLEQPVAFAAEPRMLDLGELEVVRDQLAERLHAARVRISRCADEQAEKRLELERMLLDPGAHRDVRISCSELGQGGCGVWQVKPRLGLIGMMMDWWQVKLSSGCPLAGGRRLVPAARSAPLACSRSGSTGRARVIRLATRLASSGCFA